MDEWVLSSDLVGLKGMPTTVEGISQKARRNNWIKRKAAGKGRSLEYHMSNFHPHIQKQIIERLVTDKVERELLLAKDWALKGNARGLKTLDEIKSWVELPVFDVHAAAGAGSLIESEYQIGVLSLPTELLTEYGLQPENSSIIFVDGDSMEPTLSHKDRLLISTCEQPHPVTAGVYVIRIDDAIYVKRLQWDIEESSYKIISDNVTYSPFNIDHDNGRNFKIIAKAIAPIMKKIS
ncbi:S24 family peptidase [uncultured Vibrio sp.]|uniref:helix-turn-helix domain-containing protein n=1 Tax=uncultured Vibrio sp. TaxID=114054 RepID=UPI00261FD46C|nr:S24 family peptidase [uncultured Vibrio sp.]